MYTVSLAISWIIVGAFAITFLVTIRGLVGISRIDDRYLSKLFRALILEIVFAGFFIFYHPPNQMPPYTGEWRATINWSDDFGETLLNYNNADPSFDPVNPRSEGMFYIYLSLNTGIYSGFSEWEVKNGERSYAQLVVIPGEFEFDPSGNLRSIDMKTGFRKQLLDFKYAPFTRYRMEFYQVSECRMRGKMIVYWNGKEMEVGDVILERH